MTSPADPSTPAYSDPLEWITAYLTVHSLSTPSRRYSILLWLAVFVVLLALAILHWSGLRDSFIGAVFSKWALRRRTWHKNRRSTAEPGRQVAPLPSNAQLLALSGLILVTLTLAFVGPDYLDPSLKVWQLWTRSYDTSDFVSYMPQYTISKSLWSSSARTGQIAFALFPLCVLFALKASPFAIFAIPFMIQIHFDRLAYLHKWAGRLIWFLTLIHVVLWSIQLAKDVNSSTGRVAYVYAWSYTPFIFGWIAFTLLTVIIILSLRPIRRLFYESFYLLHILLVPCMLVTAGFHHPTVAWWCWAALVIWMGERLWRVTWWIYANSIVGRVAFKSSSVPSTGEFEKPSPDTLEMHHVRHSSNESYLSPHSVDGRPPSPLDAHYHRDRPLKSNAPLPTPPLHLTNQNTTGSSASYSHHSYIPPVGYVHAELVSGRTVRLRLITPGYLPWSPGQHFLLHIPAVSRFTSHPFTCASVCDEAAPSDAGRVMLFIVRGKGGWTADLWNLVSRLTAERSRGDVPPAFPSDSLPRNGVMLRAYVDGPFGSSARVKWGNYSTAIIIVGGSGVTFGLSLLQYMCMCLARRDGRYLGSRAGGWDRKKMALKRVRFIWLVREFSHIQWCASIIRHCMSSAPLSTLQVDIYVTNFQPIPMQNPPTILLDREQTESDDELQPPHPNFARDHSAPRSHSRDSLDSHESYDSDVDFTYYFGENKDEQPPEDDLRLAHEEYILDLTNFDGDIDITSPGEIHLSRKLKKEGKLRRLMSRKLTLLGRAGRESRLSQALGDSDGQTTRDGRAPNPDPHSVASRVSRAHPSRNALTISTYSTDKLLPTSPLSERPYSASSETDLYLSRGRRSQSPSQPCSSPGSRPPSSDLLQPIPLAPALDHSNFRSSTYSTKSQRDRRPQEVSLSSVWETGSEQSHELHSMLPSPSQQELPFEMNEQETRDVNVVSEHARPGKPKLDKVIADEAEASEGAIVVACCGPTSLNAMVRKIVGSQIDPGRIRGGDMRGSITLISEEFEY